jgi:hypothetical protein
MHLGGGLRDQIECNRQPWKVGLGTGDSAIFVLPLSASLANLIKVCMHGMMRLGRITIRNRANDRFPNSQCCQCYQCGSAGKSNLLDLLHLLILLWCQTLR